LLSISRSALPGSNGLAILSFTPQQAGMSASGVLALTRRTNCIKVGCARHHSSDDSLPVRTFNTSAQEVASREIMPKASLLSQKFVE
jgi:hypothetical protein